VEVVHGALGMGGGGKDGAGVRPQDAEPARQVGGVVRARLWRKAQIRTQKRRAELGD